MNFAQQERSWERLQESLPGGPGDPCLDCDNEDGCENCRFNRSLNKRRLMQVESEILNIERGKDADGSLRTKH